ncbi:Mismatch repair protein msh3 [Lobosporangium transversale]|uniref:DNA mismatch repair protein n=1 Tax=Lobosporangium transversale TaxID=64571 RepID=A0A1Y2H2K5_9FUNG|nr:muts domain V-domain-containing protein [Lobosporangium transversale]KAF9901347.1 Mismatch repair protein msh3 [Lobosporangium transversale]ORZ28776.1 muts domain V-domain-containing protein [Lobosporangium transversale]|eukprot:XP_021886449.1 muts domain V-domain-containing protein [Lobosporangium transversale]
MSQKTLLSFFKPKAASPQTIDTDQNQSSTGSSISTKRKGNRERNEYDSQGGRDSKRRKDTIKGTIQDEPLFPSGFTSDMQHYDHMSPPRQPSGSIPQAGSNISSEEAPLGEKVGKKVFNKDLSKFEYHETTMNVNEEDERGSYDAVAQQAKDERRERFLKKLGNFEKSHPSLDEKAHEPTRRRHRLIIAESDEEGDQKILVSSSPQQPQIQQHVPINPNRSVSSKKSTKSIYTPLEKQFVEIKDQHPDAILCIEVGYKFRFFGEDAEIASKELGIAHFMDHNFYTASIPTHRLDVHVRRLVHAGYKVGVVRQMETAALKSAGDNKSAPFTRKLTNLYTRATFLESLDRDEEQFNGSFVGRGTVSQYLMCLYEEPQGGNGADEKVRIAMLAVQPSTGDIIYDEFLDGHFRNELETRLLHIQPSELIIPMESMSKATEKLLGYLTGSSQRRIGTTRNQDDVRVERTQGFVKYDKAFSTVSEFYSLNLKDEQSKIGHQGSTRKSQMETILKTVLGLPRNLIIALSAMITHLAEFGLAPVFRLSKYFECFTSRSHMLLNGNTIANLEIYRNQTDWSTRGSLFAIMDHTYTGFGRRLLKKWIGKPLTNREPLQERVDAVEEILASAGKNPYLEDAKIMLKGLMDLEKGVCRIHYGKSSPKEFLAIIQTFMKVAEVIPPSQRSKSPADFNLTSPMLRNLIGSLANAAEDSQYFLNALNVEAARKNDKLLMFQDEVIAEKWPDIQEHRNNIVTTEGDLAIHLNTIRKQLREPKLEFTSCSGIDYLVEVKNKDVAKVPKSWVKISGTKQVSRFHTPETIQLIQEKAQHQERLILTCDQAFMAFQQEFSERYEVFRDLVQNLAILDCLFSLAVVACLPGYVKPEYVDDSLPDDAQDNDAHSSPQRMDVDTDDFTGSTLDLQLQSPKRRATKATIDIKNGRHPMVEQMLPFGTFVPNDIHFGRNPSSGVDQKAMILTGPNMGGKSCYIRQVALLCIMAQIGSYLPADSARVSLLDAVFTRMGASDNIFGHESTFMVELQETSDILKMATPRSLVILDELGRGTSTLDGVAIAYAVLKHVVSHVGSITLFVTHYPSLADVATEFAEGTVRNYHMGFMASASGAASGSCTATETDLAEEGIASESSAALDDMDIVFLYKLVPGVSLKSYGLNVARMAKLPFSLIKKAKVKSKELEAILEDRVKSRQRQREQKEHGSANDQDVQQRLLSRLQEIIQCKTNDRAIELLERLTVACTASQE